MYKRLLIAVVALASLLPTLSQADGPKDVDPREMVTMAPDMQLDLINSMLDHLVTLDTILSHLADERYREAAQLAEERLTISPFDPNKAARIEAAMPEEMRDNLENLRKAGKRLAVVIRKEEIQRDYPSAREVAIAISDVTAACTGCHAHYRIR